MKFLPWTKCLLTSGVLWRHITSTRQLVYHNFLWLSELLFWLEVHVNFPSLKNIFFNYSDSTLVHIMDRVMHLKASDNTVHDFGEMCLPSTQCLFLSAMFQRLMTSTRQLMYQYLLLFLTSLICQHHIERACDTMEGVIHLKAPGQVCESNAVKDEQWGSTMSCFLLFVVPQIAPNLYILPIFFIRFSDPCKSKENLFTLTCDHHYLHAAGNNNLMHIVVKIWGKCVKTDLLF